MSQTTKGQKGRQPQQADKVLRVIFDVFGNLKWECLVIPGFWAPNKSLTNQIHNQYFWALWAEIEKLGAVCIFA